MVQIIKATFSASFRNNAISFFFAATFSFINFDLREEKTHSKPDRARKIGLLRKKSVAQIEDSVPRDQT